MKILDIQFLILSSSYGFNKYDLVYFSRMNRKVFRVNWSNLCRNHDAMTFILTRNLGLPTMFSQRFYRSLRRFVLDNGFEVNFYPNKYNNSFSRKKK